MLGGRGRRRGLRPGPALLGGFPRWVIAGQRRPQCVGGERARTESAARADNDRQRFDTAHQNRPLPHGWFASGRRDVRQLLGNANDFGNSPNGRASYSMDLALTSRFTEPRFRSPRSRIFVARLCDDTAAIAPTRRPTGPRIRCHDQCEPVYRCRRAPVAQLDRVPDYGSGGWGFESSRARHFISTT